MQRRLVYTLLPLLLIFSCLSTGSKSYEDLESVLYSFIDSCESYLQDLEDNDKPEGIAYTINSFVDSQNLIRAELKRVMRKYPELSREQNIPTELKRLTERMYYIMNSDRMKSAEEKIERFKDEPPVMEALVRLQSLR